MMLRMAVKSKPVSYLLMVLATAVAGLVLPAVASGKTTSSPEQSVFPVTVAVSAAVEPAPAPVRSTSPDRSAPSAPRPGAPKVGIQVGHWKPWEAPDELRFLRSSIGAFKNDWGESIVNMDVAKQVQALLVNQGVRAELLPVTVPSDYRADAFVSIHGDANPDTRLSGFKFSHSIWSVAPEMEDILVWSLADEYEKATGLKEHRRTITDNMTEYYAFNQRLKHSLHPDTPAVILELGFLTNDGDRKLLKERSGVAARGVANGIMKFLERQAASTAIEL